MKLELVAEFELDSTSRSSVAGKPQGVPAKIDVQGGSFDVRFERLHGGKRDGVDLLIVGNQRIQAAIIPTRGLGIWKLAYREEPLDARRATTNKDMSPYTGEVGWQSPVRGPVHPAFVPIYDPSGIGWLEGFDELLVRCGLESNGAPEFEKNGILKYPLHGRIANLPADTLSIHVDRKLGILEVRGRVHETRFLIHSLELEVTYRMKLDSSSLQVVDRVTNRSAKPTSMQMLYHINIGQRLLEAGSVCEAALSEIAPRNSHSAKSIARWNVYDGPLAGFEEEVYFAKPNADSKGWTTCMLRNSSASNGLAIRYDTRTLPCFNLWKNTGAVEDGYVTGLEPATGFPNPKSVEAQANRVVTLSAGESRTFELELAVLTNEEAVAEVNTEISGLRRAPCCVHPEPLPEWCG